MAASRKSSRSGGAKKSTTKTAAAKKPAAKKKSAGRSAAKKATTRKKRSPRPARTKPAVAAAESALTDVARSIGSTLGNITAKAKQVVKQATERFESE